jgi:hypothetical protein
LHGFKSAGDDVLTLRRSNAKHRPRNLAAGLGTVDSLAKASVDDLAEQLAGDEARANSVLELVRAADDAPSEAA